MKRLFLLWLMLGILGLAISTPVKYLISHNLDLRFEPFLTTLLAPAVTAILLLWFFPELRDPRFGSLTAALREPKVAKGASIVLIVIVAVAAFVVTGFSPRWSFDLLRGILAIAAAIGFAAAWRKGRISGARALAVLLALLGASAGQLQRLAGHVFPSQPLLFRWIVFFGIVSLLVLTICFRAASLLHDSAPDAATLLEWSLAPAAAAAIVVIGNLYWRPSLTPTWWLLANVLGCAAVAFASLSSISAAQH